MNSTGPITFSSLEGKEKRYSSQDKFPQMHISESPESKTREDFKVQLPSVSRNSSIMPNQIANVGNQRMESTHE